jgi:hypothetical protein
MKEEAELKILSKLLVSQKELIDLVQTFWTANEEQVNQIKDSKEREVEIYSYILRLIQDDKIKDKRDLL